MNNSPRPRPGISVAHAETIRRVKANDPMYFELAIGDILNHKGTAIQLAKALKENTQLKRITFREYGYVIEHLQIILDALAETKVTKISVGPQSQMLAYDGRYAMAIGKQINSLPRLNTLDLSGCRIGPTCAITLSATLANNTTLKQLLLQENEIGDEGAVAMGHMVKNNGMLKELVLDNNDITAYGQMALRNAIYDDSSFENMEKCNHVLQSYFYNPRSVFGSSCMNDVLSSHAANLRSKSAKTAVTKKLKRVLVKKYRVTLHFESFLGMDTIVMPYVLGWISERCDLDMMYSMKPILLNLLEGRG